MKLKIKRKVKKENLKKKKDDRKEEEEAKGRKGNYVKMDDKNKGYYELKPANRKAMEE